MKNPDVYESSKQLIVDVVMCVFRKDFWCFWSFLVSVTAFKVSLIMANDFVGVLFQLTGFEDCVT